MTDADLKALLETTLSVQCRNAAFRTRRLPDGQLRAPVPDQELATLEQHVSRLGVSLPPTFKQFLRITNGVEGYMQYQRLSLRSAQQIVDAQESDELQWEDFAPLHELVIGSGETSDFIAFDHSRADPQGEMPVVVVDGSGGQTEFTDLEEFVRFQLKFQQDVLQSNEADRKNLPAD